MKTSAHPSRSLGPATRTLILCAMGVLVGSVMLITVLLSLRGAAADARELANRALPAQTGLRNALSATASGQARFLAALGTTDPVPRATAIVQAQEASRTAGRGVVALSRQRTGSARRARARKDPGDCHPSFARGGCELVRDEPRRP